MAHPRKGVPPNPIPPPPARPQPSPAVQKLVEISQRVSNWLDKMADQSAKIAADTRFGHLADAAGRDAVNYGMASDELAIAIRAVGEES